MNQRFKYPRSFHLPWSPGATSDDKILPSIEHFFNKEIVVTVKMDGENCSMYRDYIHARSLDGRSHPSRDWVKKFHGTFAHDIPEGWRICGENLYAKHSIAYDNLKSYFYVFSIWDQNNVALSWEETVLYCKVLGLEHVPVLFQGLLTEANFENEITKFNSIVDEGQEGYVVRLASTFHYNMFDKSLGKYVRPNHVTTSEHWAHAEIKPNTLVAT